MADGFTVDLDRLDNVAKSDLPAIIDCLNGAQTQLTSASNETTSAFDGNLYHTTGMGGTIYPNSVSSFGLAEYTEALISDLGTGLSQLAGNLGQAKTAIQEIANRYRMADGQPPYTS